ncbi:hypothetical protein [Thalassolituus hydrocarboniclasticus]|uniref:Uncharacterized protein n=1 Tax=Thalassolituus hydrocarboniclasticus TaxID=2742796 RepID=A0ABY6A7L3_9GAMM|nr:hypothetical protein [Thalassolituus hydrocarboniclasticus]UXD86199.1 hypothetical protein HUF19_01490 [Thalassolituus hydrocarboniclasticus]
MTRMFYLSLLLLLAFPVRALNPDGFETFVHIGHVFARSVVTTDDGSPLWAEYNDDGGHVRIRSLDGQRGDVYAGNQIRSFLETLKRFRERYNGKIELIRSDNFTSSVLLTADGRKITGWPALSSGAVIVAVPAQEKRFSDNGKQIEHYAFPVDMAALPETLNEETKTLLFDEQGKLLYESADRIGYLTAFYIKNDADGPEDASEYDIASTLIRINAEGYKILDPVPGVMIEATTGYRNGLTFSNNDGSYRMQGYLSPCPGFFYQATTTAYAKLYYANFNPRGFPTIPYWLQHTSYDNCIGYGAFPPGMGLGAISAQQQVRAIVSGTPENITTLNYAVGINVLSGNTLLVGADIGDQTTYSAEVSPETLYAVADDYDGDGQLDATVRGELNAEGLFEAAPEGSVYGVYFSGNQRADGQPNITRIMDVAPHLSHEGLLKTLSADDLGKTDILVFRESTGELITQRTGLNEFEIGSIASTGLDADNNFAYRIPIRSTEDAHSFKRLMHKDFVEWQAKNKVTPSLQAFQADFLRTGEMVRIVVINRPTGYIGSARVALSGAKDGGDITVRVPPVVLAPPNLKVWATRRYQGQGLLQNADDVRRTISNEGAATTDDQLIEVHTEWLDQDGYPLPSGLAGYGYTGRLTRQISDGDDPYDSTVKEFAINPGRQLQVLNFGSDSQFHHYLQVNGSAISEQNDFSAGDHTGVLRHRPSRYVPVKVPLYDEQGTVNDRIAVTQSDDPDLSARDVTSRFNWVYRPEFSFSVIDLELSAINLQSTQDENGDSQKINIIDDTTPVISSADDLVEVIFNLIGSEYERITPFEGERQYIFALGEQEIEVRIDKGAGQEQQITFKNLEHLAQLNAEDYLTLSLYLNQDAQNVLWEWAFTTLDIDMDEDNNNGTDLPDRSALEEAIESIPKHPGKRIRVNNMDINQNKVPDFAEFDYLDKTGQRVITHFVPMVVEIPSHVPMAGSTLTFSYQGSEPLAIEVSDDPDYPGDSRRKLYEAAPGVQRMWRTDADKKRDPKGIHSGGDYVTPDHQYSLLQLGFSEQKRTQVFYLEGIRRTENRQARIVTNLEYDD